VRGCTSSYTGLMVLRSFMKLLFLMWRVGYGRKASTCSWKKKAEFPARLLGVPGRRSWSRRGVVGRACGEGAVSWAGRGEAGAVLGPNAALAVPWAPPPRWGWHPHFRQLCDFRFGFVKEQLCSRSSAGFLVLCTAVPVVPLQGFSFASSALLLWVARGGCLEISPAKSKIGSPETQPWMPWVQCGWLPGLIREAAIISSAHSLCL